MLQVMTLAEADALLTQRFTQQIPEESVPLGVALSRVLARDMTAGENVPGFVRSTVDGYAVRAADTFGCSDSIPALLTLSGEVQMGLHTDFSLLPGECAAVSTGGELPAGADAMVMIEDTEDFGGTIAVEKPTAPGRYLIFAGDDVEKGEIVLRAGTRLCGKDIGALAALGITDVSVRKKPRVTIISTGDELVDAGKTPAAGQVRDVNGPMLTAQCASFGADTVYAGIVPDDKEALAAAITAAVRSSDLVLLSGGSSVGVRDAAAELIGSLGTLLFHGLSVKPGKPTMCGEISGTPVFGLPGHPVAAYFICHLLARPCIARMLGAKNMLVTEHARLTAAIPSNHGREEYVAVRLQDGMATPVMSKSGLITTLANADGYARIPRDAEGISRDAEVTVYRWEAV